MTNVITQTPEVQIDVLVYGIRQLDSHLKKDKNWIHTLPHMPDQISFQSQI